MQDSKIELFKKQLNTVRFAKSTISGKSPTDRLFRCFSDTIFQCHSFYVTMRSLLFLLIATFNFALAQDGMINLQKYHQLRSRLKADFVRVGQGAGYSIVAERRNGSDYPDKLIFHADETSNLGFYLGTLATEYELLNREGASTTATLEELYYTLEAVNRLDKTAESYFRSDGTIQPSDLNGFFIRSDVTQSFFNQSLSHFNGGNYNSSPVTGFTSSAYSSSQQLRPLVESLDQVLNLMHGLALVRKYVNASYLPFEDGELNFSEEAKNITTRMILFMKSNNWQLKNPVTGTVLTNAQGGDAMYLSYGFAQAASAIANSFTSPGGSSFNDNTTTSYYPFFQFMQNYQDCPQGYDPDTSTHSCRQCQELYKPMMLAAIGKSYYQNSSNVTASVLKAQGEGTEITLAPLLYEVLWNDTTHHTPDMHFENLLNVGTMDGPSNHGNCNYPSFEWSAPVRWRQLERRGGGCAADQQQSDCYDLFTGEYNGLDYMLLFNLYALRKGSSYYGNYSQTAVGISEKKEEISVAPNPVIDQLIVRSSSSFQFKLMDLTGKVDLYRMASSNEPIDLSSVPPGMYNLVLTTEKGSCVKKIVKI